MKFRNTTDLPDPLLRKMTRWAINEIELPRNRLKSIWFRGTKKKDITGHAYYSGRIVCTIANDDKFPQCDNRVKQGFVMEDRMEGLVYLLAHELRHLWQGSRASKSLSVNREQDARIAGLTALMAFRENRDTLLARWSKAKPQAVPMLAVNQRREKAETMLSKWQRKLQLAKTKVAYYRTKVRYYERRELKAANRSNPEPNP